MFPYIEFFGRIIGLYPILALVGMFTSGLYGSFLAQKAFSHYVDFVFFALYVFLGVLVGGHLLYVILNFDTILSFFSLLPSINSADSFFVALSYALGGSVFYGGLIGCLAVAFFLKKKNPVYAPFIDILALCIPLFHFFGRIGCFLGGCCYGVPSRFGVIYTHNPIAAANGVSRFPVQLLEAVFNAVLFGLLDFLYRHGKFKNRLVYLYVTLYALGRFFIEFLRGDDYRGIWFGISTSQIISVVLLLLTALKAGVFFRNSNRRNLQES